MTPEKGETEAASLRHRTNVDPVTTESAAKYAETHEDGKSFAITARCVATGELVRLMPNELVFAVRAGGEAVRASLLQPGEVVELRSGRRVRGIRPATPPCRLTLLR